MHAHVALTPENTKAMTAEPFHTPCRSTGLFLLALLLLQHLLDDLLLLDQEGAHDAVPHAVAAPRTAVRALHRLLGLGDLGVLAGPESRDLF